MQNYNRGIIEEFRVNEGRVGGPFAGAPMVLVTSTGAHSGRPHTTSSVRWAARQSTQPGTTT